VKPLRPVSFALAAVVFLGWAAPSLACDQERGTRATTASSTAGGSSACTAQMAAHCTAAQAANCPMHGKATATAVTAANSKSLATPGCCAGIGTSATTAVAKGPRADAIDADFAAGACAHKNAAMTTANEAACPHKNASAAMTASAGTCAGHGARNAVMTAEENCGGRGMLRASGRAIHADCDACADMQKCDDALRAMGASMQVVPLKNGVMYIYTTDQPGRTRALQQALASRRDEMAYFASANGNPHLCNDCRAMRGAAMSGKLTREVVNIEGGCLTLMTSSDPTIVGRIHALAGLSPAVRAKL